MLFQSKTNNSQWIFDNDSDLNLDVEYLPWANDQPNGFTSQKCVSFDSQRNGYNDEDCSTKTNFCIPCQLPKDVFFHLRGLPLNLQTQEVLDVDYVISIEPKRVSFNGFTGLSSIIWEPFSMNWLILSVGKVIGSYNGSNNYPIGLLTWDLFHKENITINLKFTQVRNKRT